MSTYKAIYETFLNSLLEDTSKVRLFEGMEDTLRHIGQNHGWPATLPHDVAAEHGFKFKTARTDSKGGTKVNYINPKTKSKLEIHHPEGINNPEDATIHLNGKHVRQVASLGSYLTPSAGPKPNALSLR